ncbi:hypothetical protein [Campylobacter hyointestinalis]|uniref:hypothetical protein n=1 Tax=Campylobacter hyointestinalis TaxID=198 RepID=UPI0015EB8D46
MSILWSKKGGVGLIVLVFACSSCNIRIFQRFKTGLKLNQRVVQIVAAYPTEQKILKKSF